MKKINEFNLGEKIVLGSVIISIISLFMPWVDAGILTVSGFQQQGFLLLLLFVYPVYKIIKGEDYNKIIGMISGILAIIILILFYKTKDVDFFGESTNVTGSGMYVFILSSVIFTIGNALTQNNVNKKELTKDFDEVKDYVKKASNKISSEISKSNSDTKENK